MVGVPLATRLTLSILVVNHIALMTDAFPLQFYQPLLEMRVA
jgi:hypothetical protein